MYERGGEGGGSVWRQSLASVAWPLSPALGLCLTSVRPSGGLPTELSSESLVGGPPAGPSEAVAPPAWAMRLVEEQESTFQSSAFFAVLARPNDVRYTSIPHAPEAERQQHFLRELQEGRLPITVLETGLNLELHVLASLGLDSSGLPSSSTSASTAVLATDGPQVPPSAPFLLVRRLT